MDRSFLSNASVIQASRQFVCIRVPTYEDQKEADFLKSIYRSRSGYLENTTFAILDPDGQKLVRSGRGPQMAYRSPSSMARGMNQLANDYPNTKSSKLLNEQLPYERSTAIGFNVAASEHLPIVIVIAKSDENYKKATELLRPIAWGKQFAGQFCYATTSKLDDITKVSNRNLDEGILLIKPEAFGTGGAVLAEFGFDAKQAEIKSKMASILKNYTPEILDYRTHIELGAGLGIEWKTKIPVTDQQSLRALERFRSR